MKKRDPNRPKKQTNPKSLANLKPPIKKGEVRNPLGINRGRVISDRYEERAIGPLPEKIRLKINEQIGEELLKPGTTWAEANALRRLIGAVVEGNTADARELADRIEGKVTQRHEVTGAEGAPLIPTDLESLTPDQLRTRRQEMLAIIEGKPGEPSAS